MAEMVSVIIPTLNGGPLFRKLLEGLKGQIIDIPVEVVVVDSGSTDETIDLCEEFGVRLIQIDAVSFGHGRTRNLALSSAKGDFCVLTVQDASPVDNSWLAALVAPLRSNARLAAVFGRQVSCPQASALSRCCKRLWYHEWRADWRTPREQEPIAAQVWAKLSPDQKRKAARFDNVNSCIRRAVWEKIPFPEVPYAEDIAWAIQALHAGYSIFWQPGAQVFHSHERPLAYELKRSYVDMKNLSAIFAEPASGLEPIAAKMVIDWLAGEARRFLAGCRENNAGEPLSSTEALAQADIVWQDLRDRLAVPGDRQSAGSGVFPISCRVRKMVRHWLYRSLAGPEWLRVIARNRLFGGIRDTCRQSLGEESALLLELRGRHRFFYNQLLQIYFTEGAGRSGEGRSIRLGAAAMVAGSMLGQYLADTLDCRTPAPIAEDRLLAACTEQPFWQGLGEWHSLDWDDHDDGLAVLDRVLGAGV